MVKNSNIIIIGAGPTSLGSGHLISKAGRGDLQIFDLADKSGGLSMSFVDGKNFTWDIGGHVLFSHFDYFDQVVERSLNGQYYEHMRESWVRILNTWVPYPFQNNVRYLPSDARNLCVNGLKRLSGDPSISKNFKQWMNAVFGEGIVKYFMEPYNFKVWATPPEMMSKDWIAERVSVVDLARIERNIAEEKDDISWGPNNKFKFPESGGTGAIWEGIARPFNEQIKLNHELTEVDLDRKLLSFSNGSQYEYDKLISTIPINQLVKMCVDVPEEVRLAAGLLVHKEGYRLLSAGVTRI